MIVSIVYRFLRGTVTRRRRQEHTHDDETNEAHTYHHQHRDNDRVPSAPPDMTHIFIMGPHSRSYPTMPSMVAADPLPKLQSFKANTKQLTETVCGICLDTLGDGEVSKGAAYPHVFHTACITSWLKKDVARTCPVCRSSFLGGDEEETGSGPSSTSSIEPQRSAIVARRLAYPVYPQLARTPIQPYIYVHNLHNLREVSNMRSGRVPTTT